MHSRPGSNCIIPAFYIFKLRDVDFMPRVAVRPRIASNVSDGVFVAGEIFVIRKSPIHYAVKSVRFFNIAFGAIGYFSVEAEEMVCLS